MRTASAFAGLDPIDSEKMRKIIKSKKKEDFDKFKEKFMEGAIKMWKPEVKRTAEKIWDDMMGFSLYAFPKAHGSAYALLANATQWLKVTYPIEFFCAFLEQATDDEYLGIRSVSTSFYNVQYIMPDINISKPQFTIYDKKIAWSLQSIKGIGYKAAQAIIEAQPYSSFEDFHSRVNKRTINVRVMKSLITSNAFREFGGRNKISRILSELRKEEKPAKKHVEEWNLDASKIMPYFKQSIRKLFPDDTNNAMSAERVAELRQGKRILVAGVIDTIRYVKSKRGMMIILKIVDDSDTFSIVCWNDFFKRLESKGIKLETGMAIKVSGFKGQSYLGEEQIALGSEPECYIKILK
jgi:DNA polymerase III alpha subunit